MTSSGRADLLVGQSWTVQPSMTLDVYAGLFGDDLDAVANRLDEAVAARDADYLRTGTAGGALVDHGKRRSPGR
ncbi:hypothetical protein [Micromonospora sp. bgisy143]|uniref:hypothetical protein n=1 Tax=Micromonospora sp. bgisy143 TaxID=3413790 RepID=UPI003EBB1282